MKAWFQGLNRSERANVPLLSPPKLTVTSMDVNTFSLLLFGAYWPPAVLTAPVGISRIAPSAPPSTGDDGNLRFELYALLSISNGLSAKVVASGAPGGSFRSTGCS